MTSGTGEVQGCLLHECAQGPLKGNSRPAMGLGILLVAEFLYAHGRAEPPVCLWRNTAATGRNECIPYAYRCVQYHISIDVHAYCRLAAVTRVTAVPRRASSAL